MAEDWTDIGQPTKGKVKGKVPKGKEEGRALKLVQI
jgi:hypothetical protein